MIVCLCGPSGCGKSTLQQLIIKNTTNTYLFDFSDPIKTMLFNLLISQGFDHETAKRMLWGDLKEEQTLYFENRTPRYVMQTLGTEWGRKLVGWDLWINTWKRRVQQYININTNIITGDLRFLNEAAAARSLGGIIILINKEGVEPGSHISEREYLLIKQDYTIYNDSTPEGMLQQYEKITRPTR